MNSERIAVSVVTSCSLAGCPEQSSTDSESANGHQERKRRHSNFMLAMALLALMGLQGCSSLTHYNTVREVDSPNDSSRETNLLLVDAKQRAIFPTTHKVRNDKGEVIDTFRAFCAEPSPDALSALAAQFGASVSVAAKGDGAISGGFAESAANIGLRTASIQTLRDSMYRQCEAYANGGMSRLSLETLQRRFQSTMVALLAIEQLTGAVRAPAVVLTGKSAANDAGVIADLTTKTEAARSALTDANADVAIKQKAADTAKTDAKAAAEKAKADPKMQPDADRLKTSADAAAQALTDAKVFATNRQQAFDAIDASRKSSLTAGGNISTDGHFETISSGQGLNAAAAASVSTAVATIVHETLGLGFGREVCTSIIGQAVEGDSGTAMALSKNGTANEVRTACLDLLKEDVIYYRSVEGDIDAHAALTDSVAGMIDRCSNDPKCSIDSAGMVKLFEGLKAAAPTSERLGMTPFSLFLPLPGK